MLQPGVVALRFRPARAPEPRSPGANQSLKVHADNSVILRKSLVLSGASISAEVKKQAVPSGGSGRVSSLPLRRMIDMPDFWRLWYVGLIISTVRWVETVAVGIVVYQRTDSAFLVSMVTMLRVLPMGLFGVLLGALAERFDRGKTLLLVVLLMSATSVVLVILDRTGQLEIWHLAVASFINGCGWCTDNPVRRVMIGEVVGRERMGTAMSLDV